MIQINLLSDTIVTGPKQSPGMTSRTATLPLMSTSPDLDLDLDMDEEPVKKSKLPLVLGLGALLAVGGGAYFYLNGTEEVPENIPAATGSKKAPEKPAAVAAPAKTPDTAKTAAKAEEPKPEPKPEPTPVVAPKPAPTTQAKAPESKLAAAAPSVRAPALSANALGEILAQAKNSGTPADKPNRFDALTPTGRTAYQKFAFERLLAILRQITPTDGIGFGKVKITSPGMLSIQGNATKPDALKTFQKGLAAQSLTDTSTATGKDGAFALVARLPFNPSFGGMGAPASDTRKALQQALDLGASQGLALKASSAKTETVGGQKRTTWTLTGQSGWDGISGWLAGLQSAASPIGFTELTILAGDKGKLLVSATAVCYGP